MKSCLLYGNCQVEKVYQTLSGSTLNQKYKFDYIKCYETNNIENIDITKYNLLITQQIYEHNKDKSTTSILNKKNKDTLVIILPSLYFYFYYPNLVYLKDKESQLNFPCDYHDQNLVELFIKYKKDKKSITKEYDDIINSNNFYSIELLLSLYKKSIESLEERFASYGNLYKDYSPIYFLNIVDFIKKHFKKNLLWHSHIHPRYFLIKHICLLILEVIEEDAILPTNVDEINYDDRLPLYNSISSVVDFNTKEYSFSKIKNIEYKSMEEFIDLHCSVYNKEINSKFINKNYFKY